MRRAGAAPAALAQAISDDTPGTTCTGQRSTRLAEIEERAVEERVALAQHGDVASGRDMGDDLVGRARIDLRLRELAVAERHADGDLLLTAGQMRRHDRAREAVAGFGGRVGDDGRGAQDAQRLEGQQLRIAGADAEAVDGAGHRLVAASCVTGMCGRQPV